MPFKIFRVFFAGVCFFVVVTCLWYPGVFAQEKKDDILGKWFTEGKMAIFDFYCISGEYRARLIPLKFPEIKDTNNPVDSLRNRKLSGVTMIYGLTFNEQKKQWQGGFVYNPEDGNTYRCHCSLKSNGVEMAFRGYLGVSFLGKTQIWKKAGTEE
jgi:uncharacterized protein (DUF2147 family)